MFFIVLLGRQYSVIRCLIVDFFCRSVHTTISSRSRYTVLGKVFWVSKIPFLFLIYFLFSSSIHTGQNVLGQSVKCLTFQVFVKQFQICE